MTLAKEGHVRAAAWKQGREWCGESLGCHLRCRARAEPGGVEVTVQTRVCEAGPGRRLLPGAAPPVHTGATAAGLLTCGHFQVASCPTCSRSPAVL